VLLVKKVSLEPCSCKHLWYLVCTHSEGQIKADYQSRCVGVGSNPQIMRSILEADEWRKSESRTKHADKYSQPLRQLCARPLLLYLCTCESQPSWQWSFTCVVSEHKISDVQLPVHWRVCSNIASLLRVQAAVEFFAYMVLCVIAFRCLRRPIATQKKFRKCGSVWTGGRKRGRSCVFKRERSLWDKIPKLIPKMSSTQVCSDNLLVFFMLTHHMVESRDVLYQYQQMVVDSVPVLHQ